MSTFNRPYRSSDETLELILTEADKLFRLFGLEKTTVSDIASACGMSSANVYRFFKTKNDIIATLLEQWLGGTEKEIEKICDGGATPKVKLENAMLTYHFLVREQLMNEKNLHELVRFTMQEHWDVIDKHIDKFRNYVESILIEGNKTQEFDIQDTKLTAEIVRSAFLKYIHPAMVEEHSREDDLQYQIKSMMSIVLNGITKA